MAWFSVTIHYRKGESVFEFRTTMKARGKDDAIGKAWAACLLEGSGRIFLSAQTD